MDVGEIRTPDKIIREFDDPAQPAERLDPLTYSRSSAMRFAPLGSVDLSAWE